MYKRIKVTRALLVASGVMAALAVSSASADLLENEVLLLWNSLDDEGESELIRNAYVAAHPGVLELDIAIVYADPPDPENPPLLAATRYFITPDSFELYIRQPILNYLQTNIQAGNVISLVTTRGLPVLISTNFEPPVGGHVGGNNGVIAGVEANLAVLGVEVPRTGLINNPYYKALNYPLRDFLADTCLKGDLFAVSRLDGSSTNTQNHVQVIEDLITRSQKLTLNKYTVTFVLDETNDGTCTFGDSEAGARYLYDRSWCVYYNIDSTFLHGANLDSGQSAPGCPCTRLSDCQYLTEELLYTDYPEIVHATLGRNHKFLCNDDDSECISNRYVQDYDAHEAGFFTSLESFNGTTMWTGLANSFHGSVLDWIAYAEGSFAAANAYGPGSSVTSSEVVANLYVHGMSWAESVFSSMSWLRYVHVAIGDPLATVTVYDPDLNGDGVVDELDLAWFMLQLPGSDINGDGVINHADQQIIEDAIARGACPISNVPEGELGWGPFTEPLDCHLWFESEQYCFGDLNADKVVDSTDVAIIEDRLGCSCTNYDFDGDGLVDPDDVQYVQDRVGTGMGEYADYNGNGIVDCDDIYLIAANYCNSSCDPIYDFDCDGNVDYADVTYAHQFLVHTPDYDVNGDLVVDCNDIFDVLANYCEESCIPIYDVNCDTKVNMNDASAIVFFLAPNATNPDHFDCVFGDCTLLDDLRDLIGESCGSLLYDKCWDLNEDCIIDCTDEELLEALLVIRDPTIDDCPNRGCGECRSKK